MSIMEEAEAKRVLKAALLKKAHYCRSRVDVDLKDALIKASQELARIIDNTPFIAANHVDFVYYQGMNVLKSFSSPLLFFVG